MVKLPDWRPAMTPERAKSLTPFMRIAHAGRTYKARSGI
jgi:hypothetical protein